MITYHINFTTLSLHKCTATAVGCYCIRDKVSQLQNLKNKIQSVKTFMLAQHARSTQTISIHSHVSC